MCERGYSSAVNCLVSGELFSHAGAGKTTAALILAAETGFDVLECGMESSFSWEQRQVQYPLRRPVSALTCKQCFGDMDNSPVAPLVKFLSDIRRGARFSPPACMFLPASHSTSGASHPPPPVLISQSWTTSLSLAAATQAVTMTFKYNTHDVHLLVITSCLIHQDLRRAFFAFAQSSACPLIAVFGEDSCSDSESAVASVLRHAAPR